MNRRELLGLGLTAATVGPGLFVLASDARAATSGPYEPAFALLDSYIAQYLADMNAPGMTLALADANGVQRVATYGFEDPTQRLALKPERLFHIGSISKSFLGLCLVQLVDEGKLDLRKPIADYLPSLRLDGLDRPITAHDLLTHSAALPDGELFTADPAFRYRATAASGSFFHYSNMGYVALGNLLELLDQRTLAESFRARLLAPLGMTATEPTITLAADERIATSFRVPRNDRPYPRAGRLVPAPPIEMQDASGCVASTAGDMGRYLTMLINRGAIGDHRIVSERGFDSFCAPHVEAEHFGPGASYGYGIAVDKLDGRTRLRHTGGMVSFASALEADTDTGVGAFASINSMQGYRPRPVVEYALQLMRAGRDGTPLPAAPEANPSYRVKNARDYVGNFTATDGRELRVVADDERLSLLYDGQRVTLEASPDTADAFTVLHPRFVEYSLLFTRSGTNGTGVLTGAGWGPDWYAAASQSRAAVAATPTEWRGYGGHYRSEDPWIGSVRIVVRQGQLWFNGVVPLEASGDGRFYLRDEPRSPEWIHFSDIVDSRARRLCLSGHELRRV